MKHLTIEQDEAGQILARTESGTTCITPDTLTTILDSVQSEGVPMDEPYDYDYEFEME